MSDLVSREYLYEKTAEWEAQALHEVEKYHPEEDRDKWLWWSAVLKERTAFKFDVVDAPSANMWIPVTERLPEDEQNVLVTYKTTDKIHPCQYHDDGSRNPWYSYIDQCRAHMNVVLAWMPMPEPWGGGER